MEEQIEIAARAAALAAANANSSVMRELGDIKKDIAVNTTQTNNINNVLSEVRGDVKRMSSVYVTQVELRLLEESLKKDLEEKQKQIDKHDTTIGQLKWALAIATGALSTLQLLNSFGLLNIR